MQTNRTYLFIAISSIALLTIVLIQVNWIIKTAHIKEDLFNEKLKIVLARTTEALSADKQACEHIESGKEKLEKQKIDSLLVHYMNYYNFHVNYSYEIIHHTLFTDSIKSPENAACYDASLHEAAHKNKWELILIIESKNFVFEEVGMLFIASIILILVVIILFWRSVQSLIKEKKISEYTTEFLNNMTHEFKTPLTNIALATKMIVKDTATPKENKIKEYSGIILEENEKLRLQVEQVLSMTALEKGEIPLQKTELNAHQLITDAVKYIAIQIEQKKGTLILELLAENRIIRGDKVHLINAFSNLIDNAIKYSKEKPDILINTFNNEQNIIIEVADKGIGIAYEYHKKVFEKYFRIPKGNMHDAKGFGLGLSYIKKIIELHQGDITLYSEKGKGTTFIITLPNV
ncbi:MAG: HAMP domain-containing histidine kinase [Bacteroidia bacterium]|nr:HAMP domain-containing histidine kinase [Bacteroidia bacterium]